MQPAASPSIWRREPRPAPALGNDTFYGSINANFGTYFAETYEGRGFAGITGAPGEPLASTTSSTAVAATTRSLVTTTIQCGYHVGYHCSCWWSREETVTGDATVGTDTIRNVEAARGTNFNDVFACAPPWPPAGAL